MRTLPRASSFSLPQKTSPGVQMDLHRAAFKMESSSYLPNPLASPALMVLASTAEASRDASIPCQQPRPFGVPVSVEKDVHLPFTNGSYTFASMYHRQGAVPGGFPNREFPPSLLHLHHQFAPPNLDCSPIGMLNHSGVGAFRPFASPPEERDSAAGYQSAFTPAKRLKGCLEAEASPHLRYSDAEGKEYDYGGAQIPSSSPGALKVVEDAGKKIFAVSGLLSDRETSSSPEDRIERCKYPFSMLPGGPWREGGGIKLHTHTGMQKGPFPAESQAMNLSTTNRLAIPRPAGAPPQSSSFSYPRNPISPPLAGAAARDGTAPERLLVCQGAFRLVGLVPAACERERSWWLRAWSELVSGGV
ncbi:hypothetical protein Z043_105744 [Scleropages formosus]|uniref:Ring finger protein 220 n=1 Tax=Scleropages formosus TaxID=113540 RepID=A0A0P7VHQ2_SCLFO|nr:hypothetical protein Z043_105744 [Scleropages formosus]